MHTDTMHFFNGRWSKPPHHVLGRGRAENAER
jgi:hypothetical protein